MDGPRPGTAPCHRRAPPEHWTQVDALLQDMFSSVASAATPSGGSAPSRRPHTACAGARLVPCLPAQSSDDEESDGGSMDEGLPEELCPPPSRPGTALVSSTASTTRPSTSLGFGVLEEKCTPAAKDFLAPECAPRKSPEPLSRETELLLGGETFGQALIVPPPAAKAEQSAPASPETQPGKARDAAAKAAAKKLPKQCLFLNFRPDGQAKATQPAKAPGARAGYPRGAMAPSAARIKSHMSWANYLPPGHNRPAPAPVPVAVADAASTASLAQAAEPASGYVAADLPAAAAPEAAQVLPGEEAPAPSPPVAEAPVKKRGPKYCVAPGGSRPKNATQKAPASEFMVLEFRTAPRVVAASRADARSTGRGDALRFRPKERNDDLNKWAAERDLLTKQSGG